MVSADLQTVHTYNWFCPLALSPPYNTEERDDIKQERVQLRSQRVQLVSQRVQLMSKGTIMISQREHTEVNESK